MVPSRVPGDVPNFQGLPLMDSLSASTRERMCVQECRAGKSHLRARLGLDKAKASPSTILSTIPSLLYSTCMLLQSGEITGCEGGYRIIEEDCRSGFAESSEQTSHGKQIGCGSGKTK